MNTTPQYNSEKGAITLAVVFFSAAILLMLALRGNAIAIKDHTRTEQDATTEQAFFAAQGCIEEGYLQLRTNAAYTSTYTASAPLIVGDASCVLTIQASGASGNLQATGTAAAHERTVVSSYRDAGPAASHTPTALMHVFDRSGSMDDDSCSNGLYVDRNPCLAAHAIWGPRLEPFATAQEAASIFVDNLDPAFDAIGLVIYNENAALDTAPTTDLASVQTRIANITDPYGNTNISAAIDIAADQLTEVMWPGRTRAMLLLTDGKPNQPINEATATAMTRTSAHTAKANGIVIFSIGLGNSVNPALLTDIASDIGGTKMYFPAPTAQDLGAIYQQIADIILTYNIGQDSWQEQ
ncbi:MAG: vWA domain-containing protein [Patescibacteria group bacterium]|jgi:hypothetical protein